MNVPAMTLSYAGTAKAAKLMFASMCLLFGMAGFAHCNSGCALFNGPEATTPEQVLEHNYTTEIVGCAALAGYPGQYDRSEDLRCRAKVDCKYHLGPCGGGQ